MVAAFVRQDDCVLLCRRSSGGSQGLWELPGGKLESGETPREGLLREIREELSLSCDAGRLLYDNVLPVAGKHYRFMVFETTLHQRPVASNAHDLLAWVKAEELCDYKLAPLDVPVIGELMGCDSNNSQMIQVGHIISEKFSFIVEKSDGRGFSR